MFSKISYLSFSALVKYCTTPTVLYELVVISVPLRLDGCVIGRREDAFVSEHASTIGRSNFESFLFRISSLPAAPRHHKFEDCFRGGAEEINCS